MSLYIPFNLKKAKAKPNTVLNKEISCPFCDLKSLEQEGNILSIEGPFIHLRNKFRTFENAEQTLIVENNICDLNLSNYTIEHTFQLLSFAINKWKEMQQSGQYKSVTFFKNHGFLAGGSIHHPHMQIVGFEDLDYQETLSDNQFTGITIAESEGVVLNVSTQPRTEFNEYNIIMPSIEGLPIFAGFLQKIVHYTLNYFNVKHKSYNIVFYDYKDSIIAKVIPRYPTSSYLLGYGFQQLPTNLAENVKEIQELYFKEV